MASVKRFKRLSLQTSSEYVKLTKNPKQISAYIEVVTVYSTAYTPLLLRRKLMFGKLEH